MGVFKRAAARGVAHEIVRAGLVEFPSKEAMDAAADAVGDAMPGPEVSPEQGHDPQQLAQVAQKLIEIGQALMAECGGAGGGAGGPPAPGGDAGAGAPPPAVAEAKTAASRDLADAAGAEAFAVMQKTAAEVKEAQGALMHGGDKGNDPAQAAKTHEVAALDQKQRPAGAYQVAQGDTALDTNKGQLGASQKHDKTPSQTVSGSNSLTTDAHKSAAYGEALKVAKALLGLKAETQNTPQSAAKTNDVAKLDLKQRPAGKYTVAPGGANDGAPAAARVGTEMAHPNGPSNSPSGTNSVIRVSKTAELSGDDKLYVELFKKTAEDVGEYLPAKLSQDEKVAEIRKMMGLTHDERQARITELHKTAGDLKDMVAAMKGSEGTQTEEKKKDEKKDEKKEEKAASENPLVAHIREIANKATAPRA
jgi:hypothetical protein